MKYDSKVLEQAHKKGIIDLRANQRISLWSSKGYYNYFIASSVVSDSIEYNEDPIASVKQQQANGYPLHYLIPECKIMSANPQPNVRCAVELSAECQDCGNEFIQQ